MITDTKAVLPRGELYIKGNSVMKGYFKDPDLTSKVLDKDGWFRVGDLVTMLPNGAIQVIDRVEEYKKLQNGQFIAPQKLETIYLNAPLVHQICIEVNPKYSHLVAVITLNQDKMQQLEKMNLNDEIVQFSINHQEIEEAIIKQFDQLASKNNLDQVHRIKRVYIADEPFTFKNGLLTNTQKMKRHTILSLYRKEIDVLLENHHLMSSQNNVDLLKSI
jgi:long-chain acyl-CoA synthetase